MKTIVMLAAAALLAACAAAGDFAIDARDKATARGTEQAVEGARTWCRGQPEDVRLAARALTDVAGKGPVIEIHCDRF